MRLRLAIASLPALLAVVSASSSPAPPVERDTGRQHAEIELVFADVRRFVRAFDALPGSSDTVALLERLYFKEASAGMRAYMARYSLTPVTLAKAIAASPHEYAGVARRLRWMEAERDSLLRLVSGYSRIVGDARLLPAYFLVGENQGMHSGSEVGPLLTVENGAGSGAPKAMLAEVLAHELTHVQQFSAIGLARYRELYSTRPSLLGLAIREGVAEFITELSTGRPTQLAAREYMREHHEEVLRELARNLCEPSGGDWFSGATPSDGRPILLGYAVGAAIARAYHGRAADRTSAIRELVATDDPGHVLIESDILTAIGMSATDTRAALARCARQGQ